MARPSSLHGIARKLGGAALAIALAAASDRAAAAEPDPRARGVLILGGLVSEHGPGFVVGGGLGMLDTGTTRLELDAQIIGVSDQRVALDPAYATGYGDVMRISLLAELSVTFRRGRWEPWFGLGAATTTGSGTFTYTCNVSGSENCFGDSLQDQSIDGTFIGGLTAAVGSRFAIADSMLLGAEVRYLPSGSSKIEDLGASMPVGGISAAVSLYLRLGQPAPAGRPPGPGSEPSGEAAVAPSAEPEAAEVNVETVAATDPGAGPSAAAAAPAASAAAPSAPAAESASAPAAAPTAAPQGCGPALVAAFTVHPRWRHRCYDDPVRGGFYCKAEAIEAEFAERSDCEGSCRSGRDVCPAGGATNAACKRCIKSCAEERYVPCTEPNGGTPEAEGCRVGAGRFGLTDSRALPTTCRPAPAGR